MRRVFPAAALLAIGIAGMQAPRGHQATLPSRLDAMKGNCVLVVLDAANALHIGTYGYRGGTTPNIDLLAAEHGIVLDVAYAPGASTIVSVPTT